MKFLSFFLAVGTLSLSCAGAMAQQNTNIRGTITNFDGKSIAIATNDARNLTVELPEGVNVNATKAFTMADIKPGMMLGVTTVKRQDGATIAIDVRPIPATANAGLSKYDLAPEATMTNAALEAAVASADGQELTLNYKSGAVKVLVPPGTPMSQSTPGSRSDIKTGETIFVVARDEGGKLTAVRLQVSKDGVKPTQ